MKRLTSANVIKLVAAVLCSLFVSYYVAVIGIAARKWKVILEGLVYGAAFTVAVTNLDALGAVNALLGFGSMAASIVRCYVLRDLWLPRKDQAPGQVAAAAPAAELSPADPVQQQPTPVAASASPVAAESAADLSSALAWVSSLAKQNKLRLPDGAYVTTLETCQTLDSIVDAEIQQPCGDAAFEYELSAMIREYLPMVLKNYLAVPFSMVDDRQPNGRTPNEELAEQLQLLSGQADALFASRFGQASVALTTTGNFLREKFGHHQKDAFDFGIE